jgi:hypothetical protein
LDAASSSSSGSIENDSSMGDGKGVESVIGKRRSTSSKVEIEVGRALEHVDSMESVMRLFENHGNAHPGSLFAFQRHIWNVHERGHFLWLGKIGEVEAGRGSSGIVGMERVLGGGQWLETTERL